MEPALPTREALAALLAWRRDVRRFRPDKLPDGLLARLLELSRLAPSVGLSQPARFVEIRSAEARDAVRASFAAANQAALDGYEGERAARYAGLKLAGLDDAPVQLAVFAEMEPTQGAGLGRRTMPETLAYSAVLAIHTLWLAARVEGVGVGWVSILDPDAVTRALDVPDSWRLVAYLCIGYPETESDTPELERAGWQQRGDAPPVLVR